MRILKTLLIIAVYELSKYVTNEIITRRQANDAVDVPRDYAEIIRDQNKQMKTLMYNLGGK
ncbi:transcriptional activator RinB [Staphylococcus equorum]|uniref:transcriptional activator RinB n=1 Tax=Staphylococcus equorum TaxID=246432 RepID=UPI0025535C4B|nr:transcriptional regulator [Staphylococcus equorum]MDK9870083.1 transcriptional regulator [Staphylococcus equorum]